MPLLLLSSPPVVPPISRPFIPSGFSTAWQKAIASGTILSTGYRRYMYHSRIARSLSFGRRIRSRYCLICMSWTSGESITISKEFIFQHQNELDWKVIQKNPRIQWDWELINLYLRKVKETISEDKWPQCLLGSKAMYEFVGNYLNDEILSDIEKLYNIV